MILPFIIALASIPITATLAGLFTLPLTAVEKRLQWRNKSMEQWKVSGVLSPGERLPAVSFLFGLITETLTSTAVVLVAAVVFWFFRRPMPVGFAVVALALMLFNDIRRILHFLGNSGVWTELGYLAGDLAGVTTGTLLVLRWIA